MPQIGHGRSLFDDTPVNGQLEKGISSNWAFDENVTLRALIEATLPWTIFIDPFPTPKSNVNWDTITVNNAHIHCGYKQSSSAQNDAIAWDVVLAAGTWSIEILGPTYDQIGIYTVLLDNVSVGTIDGYSVGLTYNVRASITGITIATTAKKEIKIKMATKNPASGSYQGMITAIRLIRTA